MSQCQQVVATDAGISPLGLFETIPTYNKHLYQIYSLQLWHDNAANFLTKRHFLRKCILMTFRCLFLQLHSIIESLKFRSTWQQKENDHGIALLSCQSADANSRDWHTTHFSGSSKDTQPAHKHKILAVTHHIIRIGIHPPSIPSTLINIHTQFKSFNCSVAS